VARSLGEVGGTADGVAIASGSRGLSPSRKLAARWSSSQSANFGELHWLG